MSRLIDADALLEKARDADELPSHVQTVNVWDILKAPTIDLIRCRDCKHYEPSKPGWNVWGRCLLYAHDDLCNCVDYCSWAERREDGEEHNHDTD